MGINHLWEGIYKGCITCVGFLNPQLIITMWYLWKNFTIIFNFFDRAVLYQGKTVIFVAFFSFLIFC